MIEVEAIEAMYAMGANVVDSASTYLTVVTGYLIAAYFIGRELTRFQMSVISALFVALSLSFIGAIYVGLNNILAISTQYPVQINVWLNYVSKPVNVLVLVVDMLGIIMALIFMWSIRHPKKE